MKQNKIKIMVIHAIFISIITILTVIPFLGYIPVGPLRVTTLHIPVLIAGIVLGKKSGAIIGLVFGLSSLINNTINPNVISFVFSPFISGNIMSAVIAIVPRVLIGWVAGFMFFELQKKNEHEVFNMSISAFFGSLTNSVLVLGGIYILFGSSYANALGKSLQELLPYLIGVVATQGVVEAVVGSIIAVIVSKALLKVVK
jgi:Predicted membrane protein